MSVLNGCCIIFNNLHSNAAVEFHHITMCSTALNIKEQTWLGGVLTFNKCYNTAQMSDEPRECRKLRPLDSRVMQSL